MTLEDPNTIDAIGKTNNGKIVLVISDGGITTDPKQRFQKLVAKLKKYAEYTNSKDFSKEFSGTKLKNVMIKVICNNEPTEQMKQIDKVVLHGDKENTISVEYDIFK